MSTTGFGDSLVELSATVDSTTQNIITINGLADLTFASTSSPFPHLPRTLAIDPSGNIWFGSNNGNAYITAVVGAATPALTLIAYQVKYNLVGQTPSKRNVRGEKAGNENLRCPPYHFRSLVVWLEW